MQASAGTGPPAGKGQGQRKGAPQMGNMQMMRGPNGEMMMPQMMGNAMMMEGPGVTGNKRSRAERDAMRAVGHPNFTPAQQAYAMQLAASGMDEATRKNMMGMHMPQGSYGNMPMGVSGIAATTGVQGKKVNRRKNASAPQGMVMMADGTMIPMAQAMDMKVIYCLSFCSWLPP